MAAGTGRERAPPHERLLETRRPPPVDVGVAEHDVPRPSLEPEVPVISLDVVEICAGAGGQSLGLHRAGFQHKLAVELDTNAYTTLRENRPDWDVRCGDAADSATWNPTDFQGIDLFAGGVPCPPFSAAGMQRGASDERDLFAWAVEQVPVLQPRALLLENVRGLASARFAPYRQRILSRLADFEYIGSWELIQAADFGVAQLRPRFVLVAMRPEDAAYFKWPKPSEERRTVGATLRDLMGANGWRHVEDWAEMANHIGPTIVGGSKKHGGADLGPTRVKRAWATLGVDALGIANEAPLEDFPHPSIKAPKLTIPMVARLQGMDDDTGWRITGRKTAQYRQIGNAFPPPVAEAIGRSIRAALMHEGMPRDVTHLASATHDPIYKALADATSFVAAEELRALVAAAGHATTLERRIAAIRKDFDVEVYRHLGDIVGYRLVRFKGFIGQADHERNFYMEKHRARIS